MTKHFVVLSIASALVLSACGSPNDADTSKASAKSAAFNIPAECKDNPLLAAMPEPVAISGKSLTYMSCQPFSIEMIWGEAGTSTSIILTDSQGPIGDLPQALAHMGRELPFMAANTAVTLTKGVQETALAYPATLVELGGEDFLSVVRETPDGLIYALEVEPKASGGLAGSVVGTIKARYAMTINIEQDTVVGITAAEAAYAPWLSALRLSQLP